MIATPARLRYPNGDPEWLPLADAWSARTGIDLATIDENHMPCVDCNGIIDLRDLGDAALHEHEGSEIPEGVYIGTPVTATCASPAGSCHNSLACQRTRAGCMYKPEPPRKPRRNRQIPPTLRTVIDTDVLERLRVDNARLAEQLADANDALSAMLGRKQTASLPLRTLVGEVRAEIARLQAEVGRLTRIGAAARAYMVRLDTDPGGGRYAMLDQVVDCADLRNALRAALAPTTPKE